MNSWSAVEGLIVFKYTQQTSSLTHSVKQRTGEFGDRLADHKILANPKVQRAPPLVPSWDTWIQATSPHPVSKIQTLSDVWLRNVSGVDSFFRSLVIGHDYTDHPTDMYIFGILLTPKTSYIKCTSGSE
jgi:hypothetical protein